MLASVFTRIIKSLEGDPLIFSVLESVMEGFEVDGAFMLVHEGKGEWGGYAASTDEQGHAAIDLIRLSRAGMPASLLQCIKTRQPVRVDDPSAEELYIQYLGNVSTAWLAPAIVKGHPVALIGLGDRNPVDRPSREHFDRILEILAMEIGLSVENTRLYQMVRLEAGTDPLTRMNNRRTILQILKAEFTRFKRKGIPLSVAIIDLDKFKLVNDTLGHPEGDRFLMEAARIIQQEVRQTDHAGRYGGDEFLLVLPYTTLEEAYPVVLRILDRMKAFCGSHKNEFIRRQVSASVGVVAGEYEMRDWNMLLKAADDALYNAKASGGSQCVVR
jgi:diguanylate cyclase (GGDEF)-like protein